MASRFKKQPREKIYLGFDITDDRPDGSSEIISAGSSLVEITEDVSGDLQPGMIETGSVRVSSNGLILEARIIGGVDGSKYKMSFVAATTDGNVYEHDTIIKIKD